MEEWCKNRQSKGGAGSDKQQFFSGQNYLPLSVGMLQSYAQKHLERPEDYEFLPAIFRRMPPQEAVEQLQGAQVALFSTYVWNIRISLEIARQLKLASPETLIVFGGPQVPDRVEGFLREHPFIDLVCHGEGERTTLAILENCLSRDWDKLSGISFLKQDGTLVQKPNGPRQNYLSEVPSPYLEGIFAPLMEANPEERWIALWETNRGCPFSCTFCDWGSAIQAKVFSFDIERIFDEVQWFADNKIQFIFCCDANFGILPRDLDIAKQMAQTKLNYGYPGSFSLQNTKNATERAYQTQKILSDAGLNTGVDIALQSLDLHTLESIKRSNISLDTYHDLQSRFSRDGIETYTDLILALPGETYDSFVNGISTVIANGQHNRIQFPTLSILPNAEMGDPEYQKKYGMVTVESKAINNHGSLNESEGEISESLELVVANDALPTEDWIRAKALSWMASLLHFGKLLQIPSVLLHEQCSVSYRELFEEFCEGDLEPFPVLKGVSSFFVESAQGMQKGGPEFVPSNDWLNMWWPTFEYVYIDLCVNGKLEQFYQEAEELLERMLRRRSLTLPEGLLHQAMDLNKGLLKQPFQTEDLELELTYNLWEFYQAAITGKKIPLEERAYTYRICRTNTTWPSWDDWCREVVWYGNKRGAYFYGNDSVIPQLAGHH